MNSGKLTTLTTCRGTGRFSKPAAKVMLDSIQLVEALT